MFLDAALRMLLVEDDDGVERMLLSVVVEDQGIADDEVVFWGIGVC